MKLRNLTFLGVLCALGVLAQSCGSPADPQDSQSQSLPQMDGPSPGNSNQSSSTSETTASTEGGQAQAYPYAIYRRQADGGVLLVDISDNPDRCATLKAMKMSGGDTEPNHVVVLHLSQTNSANGLIEPTQPGAYPVRDVRYTHQASDRWATVIRRDPRQPYSAANSPDVGYGGEVSLSALDATSHGSVAGSVDTLISTAVKMDFTATFCDLPDFY